MSSTGVYGTKVPAYITQDDIDIFYSYSKSMNVDDMENSKFIHLDSALLDQAETEDSVNGYDNILEGMYNLKLPLTHFNQKGYYTIYIKPKETPVILTDVGSLVGYDDVKGLIVDTATLSSNLREVFKTNNSLVGYRIIYFSDTMERETYYRTVTSNNKVEPVVSNATSSSQKSIRYRYNENSSLVFITVTPSTSVTFKPNATPYIGAAAQKVLFVNTKFEPMVIYLNMVDHDADTISNMLEGTQLRDLDNGLVTTYNENNEIYAQHEHYTLKDDATNKPIYEVKKKINENIKFETIEDKL